jgi:hypothetical protein
MGGGVPHVHKLCLSATSFVSLLLALGSCLPDFLGLESKHLGLVVDFPGLLAPGQVRERRGEEGEDCECQRGGSRQLDREDL